MQLAEHQHDPDLVEQWRLLTLIVSGFTPDQAELLAHRTDIDLHTAVSLLEHGCPPPTAMRILL